jgi:hypothetical protein
MAKVASKPRSSTANSTSKTASTKIVLNQFLKDEIARLSENQDVSASLLEDFAVFVIQNHKKKSPRPKPPKPLTLAKLKEAIYQHFGVKNTTELKKSGGFKMATDGMDDLNLSVREGWERLYRKFIGILPDEENQDGYGCINGINIFNYFRPWQVFGLDPATATPEQIKTAYRNLSKVYHPDMSTGDARIFERINIMYKSISAEA